MLKFNNLKEIKTIPKTQIIKKSKYTKSILFRLKDKDFCLYYIMMAYIKKLFNIILYYISKYNFNHKYLRIENL